MIVASKSGELALTNGGMAADVGGICAVAAWAFAEAATKLAR